jgi:hypothetical protein
MIQIKNRYTDVVIFESKTATTIKECVVEAIKSKANLWKANLSKADLVYCKMDKKVFKQITEEWFEWTITD